MAQRTGRDTGRRWGGVGGSEWCCVGVCVYVHVYLCVFLELNLMRNRGTDKARFETHAHSMFVCVCEW